MNTLIDAREAIGLLVAFGALMIAVVWWLNRKHVQTTEHFLVAGRNVGWVRGALSIAVSWAWAPAIFIASLQSYTKGLPGAFWFIVPNIVCFFIFAPIAMRLRRLKPAGYTMPEFVSERFNHHSGAHVSVLLVFFFYQLSALVINAVAGGTLLSLLTGMNYQMAVSIMAVTALLYSLISGMAASIITDVIQMLMVLIFAFVLVPFVLFEANGFSAVAGGLGGVTGEFTNLFHPGIAWAFGIPMMMTLLTGPFADQMFYQRAFAVKSKQIIKTFVVGGVIFGLVPLTLCLLGFVAANPEFAIEVSNPEMVGPLTIAYFLPHWALLLFVVMAFAGLASTIDSAYVGLSSLSAIDIYKRYINHAPTDRQMVQFSRSAMIVMALVGLGIALLQPKLLWIFFIYGAVTAAVFVPIILSVCWGKTTGFGVMLAIFLSLIIATPLSIYANLNENTNLIVWSGLLAVSISGITVWLDGLLRGDAKAAR